MQFKELLSQFKAHLQYLEYIGINYIPAERKKSGLKEGFKAITSWEEIKKEIENCQKCGHCRIRKQVIFGEGRKDTGLMLITEFPSSEEDYYGKPVAGKREDLLRRMLFSINLKLEDFFVTPVVKCKTPAGRLPEPEEIEACKKHLFNQIRLLKPKLVLALGFTPPKVFFKKPVPLSEIRGKPYKVKNAYLFFTYHPDYILKNPGVRRLVWKDLQEFRNLFEKIFYS